MQVFLSKKQIFSLGLICTNADGHDVMLLLSKNVNLIVGVPCLNTMRLMETSSKEINFILGFPYFY